MAEAEDVTERMRHCLRMEDHERRVHRDEWTNTFQLLRKPAVASTPYRGSLKLALRFLDQLPDVSSFHRSQAAEVKAFLQRLSVGDQDRGFDLGEAPAVIEQNPRQSPRQPSPQVAVAAKRPPPWSQAAIADRRRFSCSSLLVIISVSCIIYAYLRRVPLANLFQQVMSGEHTFMLMDYVDAVWLILSMLMVCRLFYTCLTYLQLTWDAALAVIASGLLVVFLSLNLFQIFLRLTDLNQHWGLPILTTLVPWLSSVLSMVSSWLASLVFGVLHNPCSVCKCIHDTKIYTYLTGSKFEASVRNLMEPLLSSDQTTLPSIARYAWYLQQTAADELRDLHSEARLDNLLRRPKKINLCDLCRVLFWYLPFLFTVVSASFNRNLKLSKLKRGMKDMRQSADAEAQLTWQVLIDQYEWYIRNGYCLSDVMEKLVCYNEKAGRALWLFKCLDDVTAFWWMILGNKGLWVPSPEQRKKDLELRRRIVVALVEGKCLR